MTDQPYTASADEWALHLARFVNTLRPDWMVPGIRAAIHSARRKGSRDQVAIALIKLSRRDDVKSPALLVEDGPHWHETPQRTTVPAARQPKCTVDGHEHEPLPCWACVVDAQIAAELDAERTPRPAPAWTPSAVAVEARARISEDIDRARRAAGERDEEMDA